MINEGAQLKMFLKQIKLTQTELGEAVGKDQQRASKWIKGELKIPQDVLAQLHEKFNLNYEWWYNGAMPMVLKTKANPTLVTDISKLKADVHLLTSALEKLQKDFKSLYIDHHALKQELKAKSRDTAGTH